MVGMKKDKNEAGPKEWPRELLLMRSAKFGALSTLFRLDTQRYPDAVQTLLEACPGIDECPVQGLAVAEAGRAALQWARADADAAEIRAEHLRLFGSDDLVTSMPIVAPCASMYLGSSSDDVAEKVSQTYRAQGFRVDDTDHRPTHASIELKFMAHLLGRAADEDAAALVAAHDFIVDHLFTWGVVFSAATFARSEHPITRFAGLMLEHMLFCEVEHARSLALGYSGLVDCRRVTTA